MHAIASAIAGNLRTSTAPTGSRTLLLLPLRLGGQSSSGLTWRRRSPLFSLLSESFGLRYGLDSSGWPAQPQAYAMVHSESAAGLPAQTADLRGGGPKLQRGLFNPPQVVRPARWPRLPLAGRRGPTKDGSSQGRQHHRGSAMDAGQPP